jgi:UDP-N-acetyl-D-glucosamine dehydrogenase
MKKNSEEKILVGIVGLGYVGLPLAREFYFGGASVLGFDINSASVKMINRGKSPIKHIQGELITCMAQSDSFEATDDMSRLSEPDAILIAVPTPLTENREPDMSYVVENCEDFSIYMR